MACSSCPGCGGGGGCVEPTGGSPNSVNCSPDAVSGYSICPWPALTGTGCLPGGNCAQYNGKACLAWVSADLWRSGRLTVDCTATYGVVVDVQWEMTFTASGGNIAVALNLYVYITGTSTLVATIVTYTGTILLSSCNSSFRVSKSFDGGQCGNWPCEIVVAPLCCGSCPNPPPCQDPCCGVSPGNPAPPTAVIDAVEFTPGQFTPTTLPYVSATGVCAWSEFGFIAAGRYNYHIFIQLDNIGGVGGFTLNYIISDNVTGAFFAAQYACTVPSVSCDPSATNVFTNQFPGAPWPNTINQSWFL